MEYNAYTITFYSNGGSAVANISADYDDAINNLLIQQGQVIHLAGWYTDDGTFSDAYVFLTMPQKM